MKPVNKKYIILISLLSILVAVTLTTVFILSRSDPITTPSALSTPSDPSDPTGISTPTPPESLSLSLSRYYFTRELFPGLFSVNQDGEDLKSHLKDKYPGFIHNLKRSGDKIGFNNETENVVVYDIKTEDILVSNLIGQFFDFNEDQTKALVYDYQNAVLIDIKSSLSTVIFKPVHYSISDMRYSHDWKYIYYRYSDDKVNSLFRVDAVDGSNLTKVHDLPLNSTGLFSFDDKIYAYIVDGIELHLLEMESKSDEKVFSIPKGNLRLLSSDSESIYLSFKDENSLYNSIYKFNLKDKNKNKKLESFEKIIKLESDNNINSEVTLDSRSFFIQKNESSNERLCAYNDVSGNLEVIFDNFHHQGASKINPSRHDSKLIFKTTDIWSFDLVKKSFEVLMRGQMNSFTLSPSGKRMAVYNVKKKFEVYDLEKKVLVFSKDMENIITYALTPKSVYYIQLKDGNYILKKMDALTGENEEDVLDLGTSEVLKLFMSPDGLGAVFVRQSKTESTLVHVDLQTGADPVQVDLFTSDKNSFTVLSWNNKTTIYLEARDPIRNNYYLYKFDFNENNWQKVLDNTGNNMKIDRI